MPLKRLAFIVFSAGKVSSCWLWNFFFVVPHKVWMSVNFWKLDSFINKFNYSQERQARFDAWNGPMGNMLLPKQLKEYMDRVPFGVYDVVFDVHPYRIPVSKAWTRVYKAKFGGFFSFPSSTTGQEGTYINGASFFSIIGKRGWSFVSFDKYPWDVKRLTEAVEKKRAQHLLKTSVGDFYTFNMFDIDPINSHYDQKYNFSREFKPYHGQRFFLSRQFRDAEGFKMFYSNGALSPVVNYPVGLAFGGVARRASERTDSSIVFDLRQYEIARLFLRYSYFACGGFNNFLHPRVSVDYGTFHDMVKAEAAEAVYSRLRLDFEKFYPLAHMPEGLGVASRSPLWYTNVFLTLARAATFESRKLPSFLDHFKWLKNSANSFEDAEPEPAILDSPRQKIIGRLISCGLSSMHLGRQFVRQSYAQGLFKSDPKTGWRTIKGYIRRNLGRKFPYSVALPFLRLRSQLWSNESTCGLVGAELRALTHFTASREKFFGSRRRRKARVDLAALWLIPKKPLVGKRGRKRALFRQ